MLGLLGFVLVLGRVGLVLLLLALVFLVDGHYLALRVLLSGLGSGAGLGGGRGRGVLRLCRLSV